MIKNTTINNRNLWIITGITVLNAIGLTIVLPILPFLLSEYVSEKEVATYMSALVSVFALCTFFAAPIFGALSDRFGRKRILIFSLLGSAMGYFLLGIGGAIWVLFTGRIIDGLTAGNQSTLFAYISDSTEANERGRWFGILGGAIGLGFMIGPAIGGVLGAISITLPFFVTAGITLLSILCVLILLPESLPIEKRSSQFTLKSFNLYHQFSEVFQLKQARTLLIMGTFFFVGLIIWQFNTSVYLKDELHWGTSFIGAVFMTVGICDILSRVVLLPLLLKKWSEKTLGAIGLLGLSLGLCCLFLSSYFPSGYLIFSAVALIVLGEGLFDPSYNSQLSNAVSDTKQGLLQGTNHSLQALYRVIIPIGAATIYTFNHGIIFAIASIILLIGLFLYLKISQE
jgi:DHA1 family tetracycline resistance protein-like MFS transporter